MEGDKNSNIKNLEETLALENEEGKSPEEIAIERSLKSFEEEERIRELTTGSEEIAIEQSLKSFEEERREKKERKREKTERGLIELISFELILQNEDCPILDSEIEQLRKNYGYGDDEDFDLIDTFSIANLLNERVKKDFQLVLLFEWKGQIYKVQSEKEASLKIGILYQNGEFSSIHDLSKGELVHWIINLEEITLSDFLTIISS